MGFCSTNERFAEQLKTFMIICASIKKSRCNYVLFEDSGNDERMNANDLVESYGQLYSNELGIKLRKRGNEIFRWFVASVLFGAPISEEAAKKAFRMLDEMKALTPEGLIHLGWDRIVKVLDNSGYTRYDFKTADKLLEVANNISKLYRSSMLFLMESCVSQQELEQKLRSLGKGIGPTTVSIFFRDISTIWKVKCRYSKKASETAATLGIKLDKYNPFLETALIRYAHAHRSKKRNGDFHAKI